MSHETPNPPQDCHKGDIFILFLIFFSIEMCVPFLDVVSSLSFCNCPDKSSSPSSSSSSSLLLLLLLLLLILLLLLLLLMFGYHEM